MENEHACAGFDAKRIFRSLLANKTEQDILKNAGITLLLFLILEAILFLFFDKFARYRWWIFYSTISVIMIAASTAHLRAYGAKVSMMTGMMVGMTFGMQTGLMIGTIIGATNGIVIGGLTGMAAGILAGSLNGNCCGIMGIMEGMMAGLMGGIMGGMIGVMFYSDKILLFMPFFILANLAIMAGLSVVIFQETRMIKQARKMSLSFFVFLSASAIMLLIAIMLFAPKSGLSRIV